MADSSFFDETIQIQGPSFHIDLAPLDARHPVHYSRRLLIFRCASSAQRDAQLAALKTGLQALVSRCPLLAGMVVRLPPDVVAAGDGRLDDWRTIVPGSGIELTVRDLRTAMASFEELEAADFIPLQLPFDLLVPVIPEDFGNEWPFPACKVQFSATKGGTIITFAMSHSVADGSGTNELLRILSEETRSAQEERSSGGGHHSPHSVPVTTDTYIGQDRSVLRNIMSELPFNIEHHPAFRWAPPPPADEPALEQAPSPPHPFKATSDEIPVLLHISPIGLTQLKADATSPRGVGTPPISTHDALCALIWRSVLLIRSRRSRSADHPASPTLKEISSSLFLPADARRHLNLPMSYVGNAVYQLTAAVDLDTLLSPSGLQAAALALRRAITAVTPELVASYMAMLKERWVEWQFMNGTAETTGLGMGTDWTSGAMYSDDWGEAFGGPGGLVRYSFPGEGGNCVMPKLPDGSAEVVVSVMPEEVEVLRGVEGFGKYVEAR